MLPRVRMRIKNMTILSVYIRGLFILSAATVFVCCVMISRLSFHGIVTPVRGGRSNDDTKDNSTPPPVNWMNLTEEQTSRMSPLGRWLFSREGSPPPAVVNNRNEPYLILIWEHGPMLERRHLRHFTSRTFSPWEDCSVNNCRLTYDSANLEKADAVLFHLHRMKSVQELPPRTSPTQRWIFMTDESPYHTFLHRNQRLSDYNGMFNWSMTYRRDSDIPVPYGRTVLAKEPKINDEHLFSMTGKSRLVAIMGSNCGGVNQRWKYVMQLKTILEENLDIYGGCLNGNTTACPGHFAKDCAVLASYKFYLAFENSNCKEYMTEKVFWNGYRKRAVPVIMGGLRKDSDRLLPPHSFINVQDFAAPNDLASYLLYLDRHDDEYLKYHAWRRYYKVLNEHGYFQSASRHYCRLCEALNYNRPTVNVYRDLESFWSKEKDCTM